MGPPEAVDREFVYIDPFDYFPFRVGSSFFLLASFVLRLPSLFLPLFVLFLPFLFLLLSCCSFLALHHTPAHPSDVTEYEGNLCAR